MNTCITEGCNQPKHTVRKQKRNYCHECLKARQRAANRRFHGETVLKVCKVEGCEEVIPFNATMCKAHRAQSDAAKHKARNEARYKKPAPVVVPPPLRPINQAMLAARMLRGSILEVS